MGTALAEQLRLLHAVPGRMRVHLPSWLGPERERLAAQLRATPGIRAAQFNALTENLLVQVNPALISTGGVFALVPRLIWGEARGCAGISTPNTSASAPWPHPTRHDVVAPEYGAAGAPHGTAPLWLPEAGEALAEVPVSSRGSLLNLSWALARMLFRSVAGSGSVSAVGTPVSRSRPIAKQFVWAVLWSGAVELAVQSLGALLRVTLQGNGSPLIGIGLWFAQSLIAAI